jgi:thiol-disulfide isomerase/thioredoxin
MIARACLILAASLAILSTAQATVDKYPYTVTVGAVPPKLKVGRWLKNGPVPIFQRGKVYVVDSWASWCGPCKVAMPHLSELQRQYGDKVVVLGVDVFEFDPKNAEAVINQIGDALQYPLISDSVPAGKDMNSGAFVKDWLEGSGKYSTGIPLTFVIDQDGRIAWIGHPTDLDAPLQAIVDRKWDRAKAKKEYETAMQETVKSEPYKVAFYHAAAAKDADGVTQSIRRVLDTDPTGSPSWVEKGFDCLNKDLKSTAEAAAFAKAVSQRHREHPLVLAYLANAIFRTKEIDADLLTMAQADAATAYGDGTAGVFFLTLVRGRGLFLSGDKTGAFQMFDKAEREAKTGSERDRVAALRKSFGG